MVMRRRPSESPDYNRRLKEYTPSEKAIRRKIRQHTSNIATDLLIVRDAIKTGRDFWGLWKAYERTMRKALDHYMFINLMLEQDVNIRAEQIDRDKAEQMMSNLIAERSMEYRPVIERKLEALAEIIDEDPRIEERMQTLKRARINANNFSRTTALENLLRTESSTYPCQSDQSSHQSDACGPECTGECCEPS
jgi:hypothetical protein